MSARPVLILINSRAGNATALQDQLAEIEDMWRDAGHRVSRHELDPGTDKELDRILPEESALVIAAGGDGTVCFCAETLAGSDHTLGVLPLGTMNLFARSLGLSMQPLEATSQLIAGTDRDLDAASVNGRMFLNTLVLGLYPQLAALRERRREAHRHWPKMVRWAVDTCASGFTMLRRWHALRFTVAIDGSPRSGKVITFAVTNNERTVPPERTDLGRGELVVYLPGPVSRWGLFLLALRAIVMKPAELEPLSIYRADKVTIRVPDGTPMTIDGEAGQVEGKLEIRSRPGACRVRVPPLEET